LDGSRAIGGAISGFGLTINNANFAGNLAVGGNGGAAIGTTGTGGRGGDAIGGAIDTGGATVNSSTFLGNAVSGGHGGAGGATGTGGAGGDADGGAIALDTGGFGGNLAVNDSTFTLNLALGGGGGTGGTAGASGEGLGGAIFNGGGTVVLKKSKFLLNFASTSGNDVY
jgi:hypothetical protein